MKHLVYVVVLIGLLSGCASTGTPQAKIDRITPEELAKLVPPPVATVSLDEIVADSKAGKTSDEMIAKIKNSNSRYELTSSQVLDLNKQGVPTQVLDYMQQANELAKQNAIADEMNKREKDKQAQLNQLRRQRDAIYYDPFWGPGVGGFYGRGLGPMWGPGWVGPIGPAGRHWRGSRFGWGMSFGNPYWW